MNLIERGHAEAPMALSAAVAVGMDKADMV